MRQRRYLLSNRRGAGTLQLIIVLPALVIITVATIQFGILMIVQQTVTTAATEGVRAAAREATVLDANTAAIDRVNEILAVHQLMIDPTSTDPTSDTKMVLEYSTVVPVMTGDPGLVCSPPSSPAMMVTEARLTLCVDLTKTPLVNFLTSFGIDFTGRRFEISSMTTLE